MRIALLTSAALLTLGGAVAQGDAPADEVRRAHGIEILADWQVLPDVAARATAAVGDAVEVDVHAWGDTARGCYLVVQGVAGDAAEPESGVHDALRGEFSKGADVSDWASEDASESTFTFVADRLRGSVRTLAGTIDGLLHTATAACFYNSQNSDWCAPRCTSLINQLEVAP